MLTEHKILICAADQNLDQNRLEEMRGYLSAGIDMDHLIALAQKEGLTGFLYRSLSRACLLETLSSRHRKKIQGNYHLIVNRNLKLIDALSTILDSLNYDGIPIILIQGIAIIKQVYRDIGLRPLADIDLWVLHSNYQNLVSILVHQGFERDSEYPNTFRRDQVALDIHTNILQLDQLESQYNLLKKRQEEIFSNAVSINFAGHKALGLGPHDQFLNLGLHAIERSMKRLLWLVDIKNLIVDWKASDWQALAHRAEELEHQKTLVYTLYILINIFNLSLPPEILSYLERERPNFLEKRILDTRVSGHPIPAWARLILISASKKFHERVFFYSQSLFSRLIKLVNVMPSNHR